MSEFMFCGQFEKFELTPSLIRWAIEKIALLEKDQRFAICIAGDMDTARAEVWDKLKPFYVELASENTPGSIDDEAMRIITEKGGKVEMFNEPHPCHSGMHCRLG